MIHFHWEPKHVIYFFGTVVCYCRLDIDFIYIDNQYRYQNVLKYIPLRNLRGLVP